MDRQPRQKIEALLLSDGPTYALLYLRLLNKLQRIDTMQCILVYIADALSGALLVSKSTVKYNKLRRSRRKDTTIHTRSRNGLRTTLRSSPPVRFAVTDRVQIDLTQPSALETQDDVVQLKAAQILTVLLASETAPILPAVLQPYMSTISAFITSSFPMKRDMSVQCLEALLPRQEVRKAVWAMPTIITG